MLRQSNEHSFGCYHIEICNLRHGQIATTISALIQQAKQVCHQRAAWARETQLTPGLAHPLAQRFPHKKTK